MTRGTPERGSLGLPPEGPGSLATMGRRLLAFAVDTAASILVALAFTDPPGTAYSSAVTLTFLIQRFLLTALTGRSLGQLAAGLQVRRLDGQPVGFLRSAIRTVLLGLLIPVFFVDRSGRGLHDRAASTVLVQQR